MTSIHPTAIVEPGAELGDNVDVGPYCHIGPEVSLGAGSKLHSHVVLTGKTSIGEQCEIFPFAVLGGKTQDLKYKGGAPGVKIGHHSTFREYSTVNAATSDGDFTVVGNHCHIMAYVHIAHDCIVGNEVIMANAATLAGHVEIEDQAIIGGLCGIHQFVKVGRMAILGGCSKAVKDIPPFMTADGTPLEIRGLNKIALDRKGISTDVQKQLKEAYKVLYREHLSVSQGLDRIKEHLDPSPELAYLLNFCANSERGITR